jgi:hypothetical protein
VASERNSRRRLRDHPLIITAIYQLQTGMIVREETIADTIHKWTLMRQKLAQVKAIGN